MFALDQEFSNPVFRKLKAWIFPEEFFHLLQTSLQANKYGFLLAWYHMKWADGTKECSVLRVCRLLCKIRASWSWIAGCYLELVTEDLGKLPVTKGVDQLLIPKQDLIVITSCLPIDIGKHTETLRWLAVCTMVVLNGLKLVLLQVISNILGRFCQLESIIQKQGGRA